MGWKVRSNRCAAVAAALPKQLDAGTRDLADAMVLRLKSSLWINHGTIRRVTTEDHGRLMHAEVKVGFYLGKGFYSGFQEFGVASRGIPARPIVAPTAHQMEGQYRREMAERVREACDAQ